MFVRTFAISFDRSFIRTYAFVRYFVRSFVPMYVRWLFGLFARAFVRPSLFRSIVRPNEFSFDRYFVWSFALIVRSFLRTAVLSFFSYSNVVGKCITLICVKTEVYCHCPELCVKETRLLSLPTTCVGEQTLAADVTACGLCVCVKEEENGSSLESVHRRVCEDVTRCLVRISDRHT